VLLIEKGANVDAKTKLGETPLLISCRCSSPKNNTIRFLLDSGADPNKNVIIFRS
jgi:ankyrin repeat protein